MGTCATTKKTIPNVGVDKYNLHTGRSASTGASTCIIIVVLFKDNNNIFIEHRNSLPEPVDDESMKNCLMYVAAHVNSLNTIKSMISGLLCPIAGLDLATHIFAPESQLESLVRFCHACINMNEQPMSTFLASTQACIGLGQSSI
ncbi:unnamed protein product [Adineta steineri]|uniref:Uncharacterized protein n=1 Tax=Adineta steineri TaxID=433720 RepID=A0A814VEY9_9BILA|nr:unnamed protein product [Adineta steineri]